MTAVNINTSRKASFASSSSIPRAVRSGDDVDDRQERLVRNRLRWLEGQWDGNILPFESPPPATGPKSAHGRHRVTRKSRRRAPQCGEHVVTAVFKERPSEAANQTLCKHRQFHHLGETENAVHPSDSRAGGENRHAHRFLRMARSSGGVDVGGVRALVDRRAVVLGDAERTVASSSESCRDCLAQPSKEVNVPGSEMARKSTVQRDGDCNGHHGDTRSRAEHHTMQGAASPRTMAGDSDAISELSTESFTSASVDDENGCTCFHRPSNEPPSALLMAPPYFQDVDAVNILQGGARRSEIERASLTWKPAESNAQVTDASRIPVAATTWKGQARGRLISNNNAPRRDSFGKLSFSLPTAAPGFESDASSSSSGAAPSSWCTQADRVRVSGMLDTVNENERILGVDSTERSPRASANVCDEDERERSHRLLEEEIVSLKDNLRRAEIRQAAAEATASSALQRAQAAELSREVKEIQIRNLEIRLARYAGSDDHHQKMSARPRGRHRGREFADRFRSQEPLFEVEEASPSCEANDLGHASAAASTTGNSTTSTEPVVREARSSPAPNDCTDGAGARRDWGERLRKLELNFRRTCVVLGARAARASKGVVVAVEAAVAANKNPKEATVLRAAAVEGGRQVQADNSSQAKTDREMIDEYWGSDYCISVKQL